jgi:hypothetical protein
LSQSRPVVGKLCFHFSSEIRTRDRGGPTLGIWKCTSSGVSANLLAFLTEGDKTTQHNLTPIPRVVGEPAILVFQHYPRRTCYGCCDRQFFIIFDRFYEYRNYEKKAKALKLCPCTCIICMGRHNTRILLFVDPCIIVQFTKNLQRPATTRPTTIHVWKTRGC